MLDHASILRSVRRGPLIAIALLTLLLMGAAFLVHRAWADQARHSGEDLTLDLGPLPIVEPFAVRPVSAAFAREVNAKMPLTAAPVPAAKPFSIATGLTDAERATDCLAATIYYEAGNETLAGQMAVAQVVLNRVRHPAFPKTVCGVVFQGSERRTGCQFSYTCDGSMISRRPSAATWQRLRLLAASMLGGLVYAPVGNATHYHADYVLPAWSARLEKVWVEGVHIFYRWAGGWGSPRAFVGHYAGGEAGLVKPSPVVTGLDGLPVEGLPLAPLDTKIVEKAVATGATTASDIERGQYILRLDPALDPAQLPILAQQACGIRDYCKVLGWSDPKLMPTGFPIPEEQLASMSFSYLRIKAQGFEKALWNCAIFPRQDKKQCIRLRVVVDQTPPIAPAPVVPMVAQGENPLP